MTPITRLGRWFIASLSVFSLAISTARAQSDPDLTARLEALTKKIDARRQEQHIPGLSFAIVKGDSIIFSRGLGLRDIEKKLPAEPTTIYCIGSSTKAFTATLVAMMADEGKMSFDDHPSKFVPAFKLKDEAVNAKVQIRDLLSHRTGLARTELPWANGRATLDQILGAIAKAELKDPFREKFNYNNILFLTAGTAAANAAGTTWDTMIASRLLTPLGMVNSSTTLGALQADPRHATGYKWKKEEQKFEILPPRDLANIAPAGAINSSVVEMGNWVRLQLGRGEFEGQRLVSATNIEETWVPHVEMGPEMNYGLGWMVRKWNGKRLVEHGGNIDGYASTLAFLPDDGVGFAMLQNVTASALQAEAIPLVFEALFPPPPNTDANALPAEQLAELEGKYHFDKMNADMTVLTRDGKLHIDVPGQMAYELKWPNAESKWVFALTDAIAVKFNRNTENKVESITMFQAGMEFTMPRQGVTIAEKPDPNALPAAELDKYTGEYDFAPAKQKWTAAVKKGKLTIDIPGQMVYDLDWPDADKKWAVSVKKDIKVAFNTNEKGEIDSMTLFQAGQETKLPKLAPGPALPTVDELMTRRLKSAEALPKLGVIRALGSVDFVNQGITGTVTATLDGTERWRQDIDLGIFGTIRTAIDGQRGWTQTMLDPLKEFQPSELFEAKQQTLAAWKDLRTIYDTVEVTGREKIGATDAVVVHAAKKDGTGKLTQYLDPATGLALREDLTETIEGVGSLPFKVYYSAFKDISGVLFPMSVKLDMETVGRAHMTFDKIETNVAVAPETFTLTPSEN